MGQYGSGFQDLKVLAAAVTFGKNMYCCIRFSDHKQPKPLNCCLLLPHCCLTVRFIVKETLVLPTPGKQKQIGTETAFNEINEPNEH